MPPSSSTQQPSPDVLERRYENAIKFTNNPTAMVELAIMMLNHNTGITRDTDRGVQLLERAIKQAQSPRAMHNLGLYLDDVGNRSERRRAIALLDRAATMRESPQFLYGLASALVDRRCGIAPQPVRAAQLLRRALRLGENPKCMWLLATLLVADPTIQPDTAYAMRLFKRSIQLTNDPEKMNILGLYYADGVLRIRPNKRRAIKWFERAIQCADHAYAKYNLAVMLVLRNPPDPLRSVRLLKEVILTNGDKDAVLFLASVLCAVKQVENYALAHALYDFAVRVYDSTEAMMKLVDYLMIGSPALAVDIPRAFRLLERHYEIAKDTKSLNMLINVLWYGAPGVEADMQRAKCLLDLYRVIKGDSEFTATLLRFGAPQVLVPDRPRALALMQAHSKAEPDDDKLLLAVLISEQGYHDLEQVDYEQAAQLLEAECESVARKHTFLWMPFYLRVSTIPLPVHGDPNSLTLCTKREECIPHVAQINLAGLYLEGRGLAPDEADRAVNLLTSLLNTRVADLAAMNLGFVLWNGIAGVKKDTVRALELFDEAFGQTGSALAGAYLAGAMATGSDEVAPDLVRAARIWRRVRVACGVCGADPEEYERVCQVVTTEMRESFEKAAEDLEDSDLEDVNEAEKVEENWIPSNDIKEIIRMYDTDSR
ncbi:hypothetical protein BWQ96_04339 [Gracilariopsis chorda]|uniref:Uncharacterized protein n=1 Tax=Gracilariopsis chorda TaxID=448386 RepID=A0A2V3IUV8_9FLOR|nr:hypothetical protein BWQ96_04339 [Gracilariopsis chorda]|eukprot:PXF45904.1 hypothetical protein BWQ96_04339 [Gracilariopsis chorda]